MDGLEKQISSVTEAYEIAWRRYRKAVKQVASRMFDNTIPSGEEHQRLREAMHEYDKTSAAQSTLIFAAINVIDSKKIDELMGDAKIQASYAHDTEV